MVALPPAIGATRSPFEAAGVVPRTRLSIRIAARLSAWAEVVERNAGCVGKTRIAVGLAVAPAYRKTDQRADIWDRETHANSFGVVANPRAEFAEPSGCT